MFPRLLESSLLRASKSFPAIVLTGARQVGKTTLLKSLFPGHSYVSLDIPSIAAQAEGNPSDFLFSNPAPVIIDEIQSAPSLFRYLKNAIDETRHEMGKYILTGSQKFTLMQGVSESLAGRCALFELEPFSAEELLPLVPPPWTTQRVQSLVARGGFPELWRQPHLSREDFLRSYLATYLERDVRQLLNVVHLRDFERFLRACALRSGSLLNKADLARDVGISPTTVNEWLSVLEASNQILLLEPWFANTSKRLAKSPKLYFADTGLLCFLLGISESGWLPLPFAGPLWETFLFAELRKALASSDLGGWQGRLWFYRDAQGREVDFVVEGQNCVALIEAKAREVLRADDASHLHFVAEVLKSSPLHKSKSILKIVCGMPAASHPLLHTTSSPPDEAALAMHGLVLGTWLKDSTRGIV